MAERRPDDNEYDDDSDDAGMVDGDYDISNEDHVHAGAAGVILPERVEGEMHREVGEGEGSDDGSGEEDEEIQDEAEAEADAEDDGEEEEEDGEDEHDGGEDGSENDDDNDEPRLKYQRLGADVVGVLSNDSVSCLFSCDKLLLMGTDRGYVHVLDVSGNEITRMQLHRDRVTDIALDNTQEFAASCSRDGSVVITNLYSKEQTRHAYSRSVNTVALPANYKSNVMFACGGLSSALIINRPGWFANRDNIIHSGEGPISTIRWRMELIAWANDFGVKIYDLVTSERITFIPKRTPTQSVAVEGRCNLCWSADDRLLIGWNDSVWVGNVKQRRMTERELLAAPKEAVVRFLEIVAMFTTDYVIAGIAPYIDGHLVLLAIQPPEQSAEGQHDSSIGGRPELRIVTFTNDEVSVDALPINGFADCAVKDYSLSYQCANSGASDDWLFYIAAPRDIIVARPCDADDHVSWLLSRGEYLAALKAARETSQHLKVHSVIAVGETLLTHLMRETEYDAAADVCVSLLGNNQLLWEKWILLFAKDHQLAAITPFIPTFNPQLNPSIYEMVLQTFLLEDVPILLRLLKTWSHHIYDVDHMISAVSDRLNDSHPVDGAFGGRGHIGVEGAVQPVNEQADLASEESSEKLLLSCLAELYLLSKQYAQALQVYLRVGRSDVFALISNLELFSAVRDKVLALMQFDSVQAIQLLIENVERIPPRDVVEQLASRRDLQLQYLHALFQSDHSAGEKFSDQQVALYAEYEPAQLLDFLKNSNAYTLERALEICQERHLYREMVFILRRMGNTQFALTLIIDKLHDVKEAIAFVEEHKDDSLWEELINRSLDSPEFLSDLLEHVGSHYVDLVKLIGRIPTDLPIPNLKHKLQSILTDCTLHKYVITGCRQILKRDCEDLDVDMGVQLRRGLRVNDSSDVTGICGVCSKPIIVAGNDEQRSRARRKNNGVNESATATTAVVFFCRHAYHRACLTDKAGDKRNVLSCPLCNDKMIIANSNNNNITYSAPQHATSNGFVPPIITTANNNNNNTSSNVINSTSSVASVQRSVKMSNKVMHKR